MKLFVLRHADAQTTGTSDDQRAISGKGVDQVQRVSSFCKQQGEVPDVILHSPLRRARETAELFSKGVGRPRLIEVPWLSGGMTPGLAFENLASYLEFPSVMIVGHEPDFSHFIAACLGLDDPGALHIRKASLTCLELATLESGAGRLEYLLPAKLLKP